MKASITMTRFRMNRRAPRAGAVILFVAATAVFLFMFVVFEGIVFTFEHLWTADVETWKTRDGATITYRDGCVRMEPPAPKNPGQGRDGSASIGCGGRGDSK